VNTKADSEAVLNTLELSEQSSMPI